MLPAVKATQKYNVIVSCHTSLHCRLKTVFASFKFEHNFHLKFLQDVSARGIDVPMVDLVVQFSAPHKLADYVHRVGRTARAGRSGSALLFLAPHEVEFIRMLESKRIR